MPKQLGSTSKSLKHKKLKLLLKDPQNINMQIQLQHIEHNIKYT